MNTKVLIGVGVLVLAAFIGIGAWVGVQPGKYDTFAQCLEDAGATFYGAFWCPHCQEQKAMFGKSSALLPYTECSLPSGQGQTQACIDAGIESYPTWEFADGSRLTGVRQFNELTEKTGCELSQE
jgi:hypothetical protein